MHKRSSILLIVFLVVVVSGALTIGLVAGKAQPKCTVPGATHRVAIKNGTPSAKNITAERCDTLIITNQDSATRLIAFGNHDHHIAYDGIEEQELAQGKSITVVLEDTGSFHWHDHDDDTVEGFFTVR